MSDGIKCEGCEKTISEVYLIDGKAFCEKCINELQEKALAKIVDRANNEHSEE